MPPSADTLHVYATTLLISAVCTSVLLDCAAWSTPPMLHMYMADVMPVEAVWQVKLKLLPSSTVPEALLVMVGVWGTTAQKHNKHRLFHIQALQPCAYTFCTHARMPASFRQLVFAISQRAMLHNTIHNITLLPNANMLTARGMFCAAKYTHHTFSPIIKHLSTTTANTHPGKVIHR